MRNIITRRTRPTNAMCGGAVWMVRDMYAMIHATVAMSVMRVDGDDGDDVMFFTPSGHRQKKFEGHWGHIPYTVSILSPLPESHMTNATRDPMFMMTLRQTKMVIGIDVSVGTLYIFSSETEYGIMMHAAMIDEMTMTDAMMICLRNGLFIVFSSPSPSSKKSDGQAIP